MKIKATIEYDNSTRATAATIDIPESEVRRLRGEGEGKAEGTAFVKISERQATEMLKGDWPDRARMYGSVQKQYLEWWKEAGFVEQTTEAPPVEDSLAQARNINIIKLLADGVMTAYLRDYDAKIDAYEAAIRERDERAAQMMTVEDVCKWNSKMTEEDENYDSYLRRRIKERNEGARG